MNEGLLPHGQGSGVQQSGAYADTGIRNLVKTAEKSADAKDKLFLVGRFSHIVVGACEKTSFHILDQTFLRQNQDWHLILIVLK